ncbi:MAG: type IV pili methyl-accepting chemotaxis transducer N-terminal domain-containing protein, partial [Dissulfurimicrobium sp.]|uniref:type IV pili methyl-accepting chemotaxis transducer N-terminal domain-containing protein n=1 Tax=Dissulfurimicrobium TaxID=1769732 RepID=UPI003C74908F
MKQHIRSVYSIRFLIPALVAIMFIATIVTISVNFLLISLHETDAAAINMAGMERMLSQKMTKDAALIVKNDSEEQKGRLIDDLKEASTLFDNSLKALKDGGKDSWLSPATNERLVSELNKLEDIWRPFYSNVKVIMEAKKGSQEVESGLKYLNEHNLELLNQADAVTKALEDLSHLKDTYAKIFQ